MGAADFEPLGRKTFDDSEGYLLSKVGRQVVGPMIEFAATAANATGTYWFYKSLYVEDPGSRRFGPQSSLLYDPRASSARLFERTIPDRFMPLDEGRVVGLRNSGARLACFASAGEAAMYTAKFGVGVWATSNCLDRGCSAREWISVAGDTSLSGTAAIATAAESGGRYLYAANDASLLAKNLFGLGQRLFTAVGALNVIAGLARLSIEAGHFFDTGEARASSAACGVSDASLGAYQITRSRTLLSLAEARRNVAKGNRMFAVNDVAYSARMSSTLRFLGVAGTIGGLAINAYALTDGIVRLHEMDRGAPDPAPEAREARRVLKKNVTSSVIGLTGGALMMASVLMVAPPLAPISLGLFALASLVFVGQSIYDHYDQMKAHY